MSDQLQKNIHYYQTHAEEFFNGTVALDMSELYVPFLSRLKIGAKILDAGCGSGRDSKYFLDKGYTVCSFDASPELCRMVSEFSAIPVVCSTFLAYKNEPSTFDGIWASASLLHVEPDELTCTINHLAQFLKTSGIFYLSFKTTPQSSGENHRYFNVVDLQTLKHYLEELKFLEIEHSWATMDCRPDRKDLWLNAILRKFKRENI